MQAHACPLGAVGDDTTRAEDGSGRLLSWREVSATLLHSAKALRRAEDPEAALIADNVCGVAALG